MQFLIMHMVTIAFMAALFLGCWFAITKIPISMINLPNKEYWLAPDRRRQTLDRIQSRVLWLGSGVMIFWLDLAHQMFQVHLGIAQKLNHVWLSLVIFLTVIAVWGVVTYAQFRKTTSQHAS